MLSVKVKKKYFIVLPVKPENMCVVLYIQVKYTRLALNVNMFRNFTYKCK
jgi:hypothetical protein